LKECELDLAQIDMISV